VLPVVSYSDEIGSATCAQVSQQNRRGFSSDRHRKDNAHETGSVPAPRIVHMPSVLTVRAALSTSGISSRRLAVKARLEFTQIVRFATGGAEDISHGPFTSWKCVAA